MARRIPAILYLRKTLLTMKRRATFSSGAATVPRESRTSRGTPPPCRQKKSRTPPHAVAAGAPSPLNLLRQRRLPKSSRHIPPDCLRCRLHRRQQEPDPLPRAVRVGAVQQFADGDAAEEVDDP